MFDVIPILEGWNRSDARFAQTYWPWILLAQRQPLPESYLLGAPKAAFDNPFGHGSFGPDILEEYVSSYRDPAGVHGIVRNIALRRRSMSSTTVSTRKRPGASNVRWRQWAPHAQGQAMRGGHFFPEENPDDTAVLVKQFLS